MGLDIKEILARYQIQSELEARQETFRQLSLFPKVVPSEEEIQEPEKKPIKVPPLKAEKPYHRNILIKLAIVIIALALTLYIHHLLKEMESSPIGPKIEPILKSEDPRKALLSSSSHHSGERIRREPPA